MVIMLLVASDPKVSPVSGSIVQSGYRLNMHTSVEILIKNTVKRTGLFSTEMSIAIINSWTS